MAGTTRSGIPLRDFYAQTDAGVEASTPGQAPFTRGITSAGYTETPWVMGQYGGFGSAAETNVRFRQLLQQGQTGFSVALDLPTQLGLDSTDARAAGEVGRVGVPIDSLADMEALFDGIPMSEVRQIRTTANSIGPLWLALVVALAEKQGVDPNSITILIQNDVLKEYVARGTQIFPPEVGLRLSSDVVEYATKRLPNWTSLTLSGYHIREAGATASQELSFTLAHTIAYLDEVVARGVPIDAIAPGLFMFLSSGVDVLEETAKFRAARTLWSELLEERYGAEEASRALRIFAYTAGSTLTAQSPHTNIVRVTLEALCAVLGGVQTLNTSSYDEALGTPTLEAVTLALRTQQVLLEESGLRNVVDPLGGSYVVEELTAEICRRVRDELAEIDKRGGALACIETGWFSHLLAEQAYEDQIAVESGRRRVVGVNCYVDEASTTVPAFSVDPKAETEQVARLNEVLRVRDEAQVQKALSTLESTAREGGSVIEPMIAAVKAYATTGEIYGLLRSVLGVYVPLVQL